MIEAKVESRLNTLKADDSRNTPNGVFVFDSPGSFNKSIGRVEKPRSAGVSFNTLRDFSIFYPIARSCINYRKSQITQLGWDITTIQDDTKAGEEKAKEGVIKEVKDFFNHISDSGTSLRQFLSVLVEDILVLDAAALYKHKTRGGDILRYLPIDASTIRLLVNEDGTKPQPPDFAFEQVIKGKVEAELTTDELIYRMMNPRTNTPYGLSPLESLIVTVTTALKTSSYNLSYLTEGNTPEGLVTLPKDIAANLDKVKEFQTFWDSLIAGDPKMQRRMRFLPEGSTFLPTKKSEDMSFERFEKWLLQCTCSVFGVPPQDIGFTYDVNKATGEVQDEKGKERGLYPLTNFIKEIFDDIIQTDLGKPDLEFTWVNLDPSDAAEEAKVWETKIKVGRASIDEWREAEGEEPIGLSHFVLTSQGPKLVKDILNPPQPQEVNPNMQNPNQEAPEPNNEGEEEENKKPNGKNPTPPKIEDKEETGEKLDDVNVMDELRRWKKCAIKDVKAGKEVRDFKSQVIPESTQMIIRHGLEVAKTSSDIYNLFEPFLSPENRVIEGALELYDELGTIFEQRKQKSK